jgi:hypothetical protein
MNHDAHPLSYIVARLMMAAFLWGIVVGVILGFAFAMAYLVAT